MPYATSWPTQFRSRPTSRSFKTFATEAALPASLRRANRRQGLRRDLRATTSGRRVRLTSRFSAAASLAPGHGPCPGLQFIKATSALVFVQPRRLKRTFIAATARGQRWPVAGLISPVFEPLISAAERVIDGLVAQRLFVLIGKKNHQFCVRLANPTQLDRYLHTGQRPPRFPAGGRSRLQALWKSRRPGAQIEVTESMAVIAMRAVGKSSA